MALSWRQLASLLGPPGPMPPLVAWLASPQANDRRILLRSSHALTLLRLDAVLTGGSSPSVSVALRHGSDLSAAGTALTSDPITITSASNGQTFSDFQAAAIPADHWLWLQITANTGSPESLTLLIELQ